jgi:hypothetical protein
LDAKVSAPYIVRMIGPAPIWPPSSNTARKAAKFMEMYRMPKASAFSANSVTMVSVSPLIELWSRRITSSEAPVVPQGTNESMPTTFSSSVPAFCTASTRIDRPSCGSPSRPSAMEKPRSSSVSRQASARAIIAAICSSLRSS